MLVQFIVNLSTPISQSRLERYRPRDPLDNPIGPDMDMLVNYFWNMALAESLYPALHAVEIALGNTIHTTLTNHYLTEEWWRQPTIKMLPRQHTTITEIEAEHLRNHGAPITPGKLVSELNFGFWTTLLSQPYESRIWRYRSFVLRQKAFPQATGLPRSYIHARFNDIRFLRNRVMYYEAIYHRSNLATDHSLIHAAIRWISPELLGGIQIVDNFPNIFLHGRNSVYDKLHGLLGGP